MISPDGWLDWAIKMPGRPVTNGSGFNPGVNGVKGITFHSAEGFAQTLLSPTSQWGYYSAQFPWHVSNLLDGRLVQHYPFTARCWHGSAFNDDYVGMENEGRTPDDSTVGPALNDGQIANARRVIADLSEWKGWTPKRPTSATDKTATLYEHTEVVRFGGSGTQCPSRRIPWELILEAAPAPSPPAPHQWLYGNEAAGCEVRGNQLFYWHRGVEVDAVGDFEGAFPGAHWHNEGGNWRKVLP